MNAQEYSKRGENYFTGGKFDEAIADFSEAIKLEPDNPFSYNKRGGAYINKKEYDLALTDFNKAIELYPNKVGSFYVDRGITYVYKGDKTSAITDLETAINIDPQNKDYKEMLEEIKSGKAENDIKKAVSTSTKSVETLKKEIKFILISGIICAIIGAVLLTIFGDYSMTIAFTIIFGAWAGFGVGGNLSLFIYLFVKGQTLFGYLDFGWWDSKSSFGLNIFLFFFRIFLGFFVAYAGFMAFCIVGPIWSLIRILMKKSKIKKM
jgi:tetratricopeptide (TPR) repeat protein